jgi:hypothetical protein
MRAIAVGVQKVAEEAEVEFIVLNDQNGLAHVFYAFPACARGPFRRIGRMTQLPPDEGKFQGE